MSSRSPLGLPTSSAPRVDVHGPVERSAGPLAIEFAEKAGLFLDPWQQESLMIDLAVAPDGTWQHFETCELVSRQNGKGAKAEARVLAGLFLFGEKLIMWSAHEYKTAIEMFLRIVQLVRRLIEAGEIDETNINIIRGNNPGRMIERLDTGQRLMFIARSDGSGRGFSGDVNIIDEAFAYTPEQDAALTPTMSARDNPQIMYLSTPPLDGLSGQVLYELRDRALAGGDGSLAYRDWGAEGDLDNLDRVNLDDEELWLRCNPSTTGPRARPTLAFMRKERKKGDTFFARERLGIWPRRVTSGAGVIAPELWRALLADAQRPSEVAFAAVVSSDRRHAVVAAAGRLADGRLVTTIVDYRPGTDWLVARLAELKERWDPVAIAVQDKGPTGSLLPEMAEVGLEPPEDRDEPRRGDVVIPYADDVADAYGMWVDAVLQQRLHHFDDAPLNVALDVTGTRALSGATAWDFRDPRSAPIIGSTLALWAYLTLADKVSADYDVMESIG